MSALIPIFNAALLAIFVTFLEIKHRELSDENDTGERKGCDREHD